VSLYRAGESTKSFSSSAVFAIVGIVALAAQAFVFAIVTLLSAAALMGVAFRAGDA
jgi:hypothetical protein